MGGEGGPWTLARVDVSLWTVEGGEGTKEAAGRKEAGRRRAGKKEGSALGCVTPGKQGAGRYLAKSLGGSSSRGAIGTTTTYVGGIADTGWQSGFGVQVAGQGQRAGNRGQMGATEAVGGDKRWPNLLPVEPPGKFLGRAYLRFDDLDYQP